MAATTLLDFATSRRDAYQAAIGDAEAELAQAQQDERDARADLGSHTASFEQFQQSVEALRRQLADIPAPADGEPLLEQLREAIVNLRQELVALMTAQEELDAALARGARASRMLERERRSLVKAERHLTKAELHAQRRAAWRTALGDAPLSTLPSDAAGVLNSQEYQDVKDAVEAAIPAALRSSALARRNLALARVQLARELRTTLAAHLAAEHKQTGGVAGIPLVEQYEFDAIEAALLEFVLQGKDQFDLAVAQLQQPMPEITAAQRASLADLEPTGAAAAAKEEAVTVAQITVDETALELTRAGLLAAADPDGFDPADLAQAEQDHADAVGVRDAAATDFNPILQADLDAWQVVLPDTVWRFFLAFVEATEVLSRLKDVDPAALDAALTDAETTTLTAALAEAAEAQRRQDLWQDHLFEATTRLRTMESGRANRVFSALRGDG